MGTYDFAVQAGVDWSLKFPIYDIYPGDITDLNLWSGEVRVHARRWIPSALLFRWGSDVTAVSVDEGLLAMGDGGAEIVLSPAQSAAFSWDVGWWTLSLVSPSRQRSMPLSGLIRIDHEGVDNL